MAIIAAYNFCNQDFDSFLAGAAAVGFENVAVGFYAGYYDQPLETMTDEEAEAFLFRLESHDLRLVAVYARSELTVEGGLDLLRRRLEGAARLGVSIVDTGAVRIPDEADQDERERMIADFVAQIRDAADHAAELGITIALETHGGYTGDASACLAAMEQIDHPEVRLAFDPANFRFYNGADPHERLDELAPFMAHTHYKDHVGPKGNPEFPRIGEGEVGYDRLLPRLVDLGYEGPHTLERAPGRTNDEIENSMRSAYRFLSEHLS